MQRAVKFYKTVFNVKLEKVEMNYPIGKVEMAWFPFDNIPGSPGALIKNEKWIKPNLEGVLVYFTTPSGDLDKDLEKIEAYGGKVISTKHKISDEIGYVALFIDSEGNKIAMHSRK